MFGIGAVALLLLVTLPFAVVFGHRSGRARRMRTLAKGGEVDIRSGETTVGAMFALLGLLLAFSFGNSLSLSDSRKTALIDEAAALGTAFSRVDYLPDPGRTELRRAILAYALTRVGTTGDRINSLEKAHAFLDTSLEAQAKLWPLTVAHTADPVPPPIKTFVASAMNDLLDAHLYRMKTISVPVSEISQFMMLAAALAGLFLLGNRSGLMGRALTWRTFVLATFLFVVMITILDTERGNEGLIRIDESTLRATIADMERTLGI